MTDNKQGGGEVKKPNAQDLAREELEDEDEGYTCGKCCRGYESCIIWTCKVRKIINQCIYNTIVGIKDCIKYTCAAMWYPIKERCCSCCDNCDKKNNPYKDPYMNPYDTL